jgi:guanylate kinase
MKLVVLTAPSGAGKTTIARHILSAIPTMRFSVSATTRPARPGETDGVDYHFLTKTQFDELLAAGAFIEHEEVYEGLYYGTLKSELEQATADAPILLDIDVKGALNVKRAYGDSVYVVYIKAPSLEELEKRLRLRATEADHSVEARLRRARDEQKFEDRFDHVVVNDNLQDAVAGTITHVLGFLSATDKFSSGQDQNTDQLPTGNADQNR